LTPRFPTFYFLTVSFFYSQAAEIPKPRDVESPKDSGVRKRKGGQANVIGQGGREYLTVASMDSALSHSLASEDSDNELLEQR